ncbi:MAG: 7,8-didemethyl-8-hydroxy-5-deazariboflavin synthase CofG [Candidatus Nezhaarchaeota archaeon]|nr:7,8-didemethyl-8-hydroxy-5-deazariboflavin synthase CofG [Candidatus Nezhaarchaeota archaeon]
MVREVFVEALSRALKGELTLTDSLVLARAEGEELIELLKAASFTRDRCFGRVLTYSRKVFVPLTNICRNKCKYCGFRREPWDPQAVFMSVGEVLELVKRAEEAKVKEVLLCTGEKPEARYPQVRERLRSLGYSSFTEYVCDVCDAILERSSTLLIHVNLGVLEPEEIEALKPYVVSMGLMLECGSERLCMPGMPHEWSPTKHPRARLRTIEGAGRLRVPFTTGILVGIGETVEERVESLFMIKRLHERYGHIQEVIVQNFQPHEGTPMGACRPPPLTEMLKAIAIARLVFKGEVSVQAPPNLEERFELYIDAGINDWGGVSPLTVDYINPQRPWPSPSLLKEVCEKRGYLLRERLAVYPRFIAKEGYVHEGLRGRIELLVGDDGLVRRELEAF